MQPPRCACKSSELLSNYMAPNTVMGHPVIVLGSWIQPGSFPVVVIWQIKKQMKDLFLRLVSPPSLPFKSVFKKEKEAKQQQQTDR